MNDVLKIAKSSSNTESYSEMEIYPLWHLQGRALPPRSSLISLAPMNIGTSDVESLTSYIARLALEYLISPVLLLKYGLVDKGSLPKNLMNTDSIRFPKSINGMGETTESIVNGLRHATLREDIYLTTLLGWKGILSSNNLFKSNRAWCALCFSEQIDFIGFNYEKLLWSLQPVKKCSKHQILLENNCLNCNRALSVFCGQFRPGYCSSCFKWLGNKDYTYKKRKTLISQAKNTVESQFEELVVKSYLANLQPADKQFIQNLSDIIKQFSFGSINEFSHQAKIWHNNIRLLLKGKILPTWEVLSNISSAIEISISDILITPRIEVSKKNPEYEKAVSQIRQNIEQLSTLLNPKDEKLKQVIEIYIFEYPPPSANEIAKRLGYSSSDRLKLRYPDLYEKIVDKYIKYIENKKPKLSDNDIEQILIKASEEAPPPSLQSVFRRIGCHNTGYRYYNKFPQLCSLIAQRYKKSLTQLSDTEKIEAALIEALIEIPPPAFSKVAKRLKCKRESLKRCFPELASKIISRKKEFPQSEKEKKFQKAANEIEEHNLLINRTQQAPLLKQIHALYINVCLRNRHISIEEKTALTKSNDN